MTASVQHILIEAALEAGARLRASHGQALDRVEKGGDLGFATQADLAAQEIILNLLQEAFPGIPVVAEEQPAHVLPDGPCFVVDPLDGTGVYAEGTSDAYGVALAFLDGTPLRPRVGVLYQPARDVLFVAEHGSGVKRNGKVLSLRAPEAAASLPIAFEAGRDRLEEIRAALTALQSGRPPVCFQTSVGDAAALLEGRVAAVVNAHPGTSIWDVAAFALAVEEAGGVACALDGEPLRWDEVRMTAMWAANPDLLDQLILLTRAWKP